MRYDARQGHTCQPRKPASPIPLPHALPHGAQPPSKSGADRQKRWRAAHIDEHKAYHRDYMRDYRRRRPPRDGGIRRRLGQQPRLSHHLDRDHSARLDIGLGRTVQARSYAADWGASRRGHFGGAVALAMNIHQTTRSSPSKNGGSFFSGGRTKVCAQELGPIQKWIGRRIFSFARSERNFAP